MLCIFRGYGALMLLNPCGRRPVIQLGCSVWRRGKRVRRLSVWLVLGRLTVSAGPTRSHTVAPDRGKPGSGVNEAVAGAVLGEPVLPAPRQPGRGWMTPLAPSDLRVAGLV